MALVKRVTLSFTASSYGRQDVKGEYDVSKSVLRLSQDEEVLFLSAAQAKDVALSINEVLDAI